MKLHKAMLGTFKGGRGKVKSLGLQNRGSAPKNIFENKFLEITFIQI